MKSKRLSTLRGRLSLLTGIMFFLTVLIVLLWNAVMYYHYMENFLLLNARLVFQKIITTQSWVYDHRWPFIEKKDNSATDRISMHSSADQNSPDSDGPFRFRLITLQPSNILYTPDRFEKKALTDFKQGKDKESYRIGRQGTKIDFRYIASLEVRKICLRCHEKDGYREGDSCGGISISIPISSKYSFFWKNLLLAGIVLIVVLGPLFMAIFFILNRFVFAPLKKLDSAAVKTGEGNFDIKLKTDKDNKIDMLFTSMERMADEKKELHRELEDARNFTDNILSSIQEWVRIIDLDCNVIFSNKSMQDVTAHVKGKKCYELWGEKQQCKDCLTVTSTRKRASAEREIELNGRYYHVQCYPMIRRDGGCKEAIEVIRDVTAKKLLEIQLREQRDKLEELVERRTAQIKKTQEIIYIERRRLETIIENIEDGIFVIDNNYTIEFLNQRLIKEHGQIKGKKCYEVIAGEKNVCNWCKCSQILSDKKTVHWEWQSPKNARIFDSIASSIINIDGTISILILMHDITARRRAEELMKNYSKELEMKVQEQTEELKRRARLAALGEIAAGLAHELRNPMGAIISGIALLSDDNETAENRRVILDILKKETYRLNSSLNDILSYARPRSPVFHLVDVNNIMGETLKAVMQDKNLFGKNVIKTNFSPSVKRISADSTQIQQVFWNVLINALQAMDGKGVLSIETGENDRWVWVKITDTGRGIEPEFLEKIFLPFFTKRKGGTGLGLATAARIVDEHGGKIEVKSMPGEGTTFVITFPCPDGL